MNEKVWVIFLLLCFTRLLVGCDTPSPILVSHLNVVSPSVEHRCFASLSPTARVEYFQSSPEKGCDNIDSIYFPGGPGGQIDIDTFLKLGGYFSGFNVAFVNPPNTGRSTDLSPQQLTVESQIDLLKIFIEGKTKAPPILIGSSWGAIVVASYAARYPHSVSGVMLMSPAPFSVDDEDERDACIGPFDPNIVTCLRPSRALRQRLETELSQSTSLLLKYRGLSSAIKETSLSSNEPLARIYQGSTEVISNIALRRSYKNLQIYVVKAANALPALVVHGTFDFVTETERVGYKAIFPKVKTLKLPFRSHQFSLIDCAVAGEMVSFFYQTRGENPKIDCAINEKTFGEGRNMRAKYVSILVDGRVPTPQ